MKKLTLIIALSYLVLAAHCPPDPVIVIADDIVDCDAADAKLVELGCPEGHVSPDGQTFAEYCKETMTKGHGTLPSCLKTITDCSEVASKCGQ